MVHRRLELIAKWYLAGLISDEEFLDCIKQIQSIERQLVQSK